MNITGAELKSRARKQMSGKFGALFVCFLAVWGIGFICTKGFGLLLIPKFGKLYMSVFDVIKNTSPDLIEDMMENDAMTLSAYSNLANVLSIAYWFLVYPMISVGLAQVLLNLTYGDRPQASTVFEPFKTKFGKSIGTVWLKRIFEILWVIPFYFGWLLCVGITIGVFVSDDSRIGAIMDSVRSALGLGHNYGDAILSVIGMILWFLFVIGLIGAALMIPYSIIISKYAMALFVMNENPDYSSSTCIDESKAMMQGHRWEFFVLKLSFIPWFLLCCIPFVGWISLAYTIPYMQVTFTNFYHEIKPMPVQTEFQYADAGDITEVVETAADNIMGEGFEQ